METHSVLFRTARFAVRRLDDSDLEDLLLVYGDAVAMQWVGDGQPLDRDSCQRWISVTKRNYAVRGYGMFAIVSLESDDVAGFCGIVHPGNQEEAEVKYALKSAYRGKGVATEVVRALLDYAGNTLGLDRIIATVAPDNLASQKVLLKAGLQRIADRVDEEGETDFVFRWMALRDDPAFPLSRECRYP